MLPVGVTIMFEDNLDHSNHAGRTWERTSVGRVPVGIDTTQTEFDTIGKTGGSKAMQKHNHTQPQRMMVWDARGPEIFGSVGTASASARYLVAKAPIIGANGTPRVGNSTEPQSAGINFVIKT